MKASAFSLMEAKYTTGENIKHIVRENVDSTTIRVRAKQRKRSKYGEDMCRWIN